jgi:LysM repeat protein
MSKQVRRKLVHKGRATTHKVEQPRRKRKVIGFVAAIIAGTAGAASAYEIQWGDTLGGIAREKGTSASCLARVNGITNADLIYAGEQLNVRDCIDIRDKVTRDKVTRHKVTRDRVTVSRSARRATSNEGATPGPIPAAGARHWHSEYPNPAVDINIDGSGDCGNPVRSAAAGVVDHTYWGYGDQHGRYGNHIIIDGRLYAHLSDIDVRVGEQVVRGEVIGNVGSTGNSSGCHLHYEYGR